MTDLTPGTRLGVYEVSAKIGEGGMGEVYQARDTSLDRDVALKVMPEAFTADSDRLARFEREAKVLASLSHPNIGGIHGLETQGDTRALILELIEGPTLADRIKQGPIPLDEALPIARQIAEALEAAHETGVIHRDLKPANIKVRRDGTVKVLDTAPQGDPNQSPTLTAAATQMGVIMGTAAYMSPEQARGRPVDKRADIWAFGCVLYEMLTGRRAFEGEDVSLTLAEVMKTSVDLTALPKDVPPTVRTALARCLEKDPARRIRDIGDVSLAMEGAFEPAERPQAETSSEPTRQLWQRPLPAVLGAIGLLAAGGLAVFGLMRAAGADDRVMRFPVLLPAEQSFSFTGRHAVAIAPEGDLLAYVAEEGLWVRPIDQLEATRLRGPETGARNPFFSPDGQSIGFYAVSDRQLRRVSVAGGAPVTLGAATNPLGVTWGPDDTIVYGQSDGIWQVPGTSGTPQRLIATDLGDHVCLTMPDVLWPPAEGRSESAKSEIWLLRLDR